MKWTTWNDDIRFGDIELGTVEVADTPGGTQVLVEFIVPTDSFKEAQDRVMDIVLNSKESIMESKRYNFFVYEHWATEDGKFTLLEVSTTLHFNLREDSQVFICEYTPAGEGNRALYFSGKETTEDRSLVVYEHWVPDSSGEYKIVAWSDSTHSFNIGPRSRIYIRSYPPQGGHVLYYDAETKESA